MSLFGAEPSAAKVKVQPRETDELFANPGMGWQTFHRFADDDPNLQGLPSGSAYFLPYKSAPVPDGTRAEIERFLRRLGYRLVIRELEHAPSVRAGGQTAVTISWENAGVAPPYRDYRVALRLRASADTGVKTFVSISDQSIRGWMPGPKKVAASFHVPESFDPGRYELAVGVVDPASKTPAVRLAIAGRDDEGWYPVSHIQVER